jgi:hypothetical protein
MSIWSIILWLIVIPVIVCTSLLLAGHYYFKKMVAADYKALLEHYSEQLTILTEDIIKGYPPIVEKWLKRSGVLHKVFNGAVHLHQQGEMRTSRHGKWMPVKAEQWYSTVLPGFLWKADVKLFPWVYLYGRDKFICGKGNMLISLFSFLPVVKAKGPEADQGSMLRYLAEIVWFPYMAVSNYIRWEEMDELSARATITYGGISASAIFRFNQDGDFTGMEARRYYLSKGRTSLEDWEVETAPGAYRMFEGVRVPDHLQVTWKLKSGSFTWLHVKIADIKYHEHVKVSA